jgi:hypothetical protein
LRRYRRELRIRRGIRIFEWEVMMTMMTTTCVNENKMDVPELELGVCGGESFSFSCPFDIFWGVFLRGFIPVSGRLL